MKTATLDSIVMVEVETVGSSLMGYLPKGTTYKQVLNVFGKPQRDYSGHHDKIQVQWVGQVCTSDGLKTFTIYDYKSDVSPEQNYDWHIGGHDLGTYEAVLAYFKSHSEEKSEETNDPVENLMKRHQAILAHQIDFTGLELELSARLGAKNLKFTGEIELSGRHPELRISFESNELKNQCGVMYSMFKSNKIRNFSNSWSDEENCFWIIVNFSYQHVDGGSNGMEICTAYYFPDTKNWEFKFRKEQ